MMDTPLCDFVNAYRERATLRLHMPGHKGRPFLGLEDRDITEIAGADELYRAQGVILQSEKNAASLFGTEKTVYCTEGSSLCIRAMVHLALLWGKKQGRKPVILAGRNAHRAFLSAAALLDAQVEWLYPEGESTLISCLIGGEGLGRALDRMEEKPAAVYITSPDYLGNRADIAALSKVCGSRGVLLLVDNAHGAYLKFLPKDQHPITLGADMCCDSAHKTLPVLTGGAYLHIRRGAPAELKENAERAMALFASTSPSYLIMQSLDRCNAYLADRFSKDLSDLAEKTEAMKIRLRRRGYALRGDEPIKLTIAAKQYGYTGDELHDLLRKENMECEFSDPDFLTAMLTPQLPFDALPRLENALLRVPPRAAITLLPPRPPKCRSVLSIRQAMLSPARQVPIQEAGGCVLADAQAGCPPCVPIVICGEEIDWTAIRCFQYYGIQTVSVVDGYR